MTNPMTTNERLLDAFVNRQVDVSRYTNGVVRKVMALLNRSDADLFARLSAALENAPMRAATIQALTQSLQGVRELNDALYRKLGDNVGMELRDFTANELNFQSEALGTIPPVALPVGTVSVEQAYAAVLARPFQGRVLSEWARDIGEARMVRIRDAVRMGFVNNESVGDIVRRLRGSKANGYADGLLEIDRRGAESVVRTAINHTAAVARQMTYDANRDLIASVQWVSTLDNRTSPICRVRDGLRYTCTDHKPIGHAVPWLGGPGAAHWNCRSTSVPVLKSWRELGLNADEMDASSRASMDGQVPGDLSYGQWFAKQSAARQDEIVGPTRGELFRAGKVSFDRFTNDKGRWLTLEQLQQLGAVRKVA